VALLSRNIHLRGSARGESTQKGWGGHIMVLGAAQLRIGTLIHSCCSSLLL
jgi:hypothetical protein